jgi:hypothetical protein
VAVVVAAAGEEIAKSCTMEEIACYSIAHYVCVHVDSRSAVDSEWKTQDGERKESECLIPCCGRGRIPLVMSGFRKM